MLAHVGHMLFECFGRIIVQSKEKMSIFNYIAIIPNTIYIALMHLQYCNRHSFRCIMYSHLYCWASMHIVLSFFFYFLHFVRFYSLLVTSDPLQSRNESYVLSKSILISCTWVLHNNNEQQQLNPFPPLGYSCSLRYCAISFDKNGYGENQYAAVS